MSATDSQKQTTPPPHPEDQKRLLSSADILQGDVEVLIDHHGEIYRLRETRNGKLILGK